MKDTRQLTCTRIVDRGTLGAVKVNLHTNQDIARHIWNQTDLYRQTVRVGDEKGTRLRVLLLTS